MPENVSSIAEKAALSPGSLVYVGEPREEVARIEVITFDTQTCMEQVVESVDLKTMIEQSGIKWIRVNGIHDVDAIKRVGDIFEIHALVLEDIVNTKQRPKVEDFDEYLFIVMKRLSLNKDTLSIEEQHIGIILYKDIVISFVDGMKDPFSSVRQRILSGKRRIRRMGADYLAYALIDVVVDGYFRVIEDFSEMLDTAETEIFEEPEKETLKLLYNLKRADLHLRKSVLPLREATGYLIKEDSDLLSESTIPFIRDVQDHLSHIMEAARIHEDTLDSLLELYQNSQSHRLNEVMKFLTIVATVFIPMTFIAGIYGMNFKYMPELEWAWGYPMTIAVMVGVVMTMLYFLHRKRWL